MKKLFIYSLTVICLMLATKGFSQNPENFELKSATNNNKFILNEHKGKYVVLHFLLKTECPFCLRYTNEYFKNIDSLKNVVHVFIKPDEAYEIKSWAEGLPKDILNKVPIYRDLNAQLAKKFNVKFGYHFHEQIIHYPTLIIINPNGIEVFRYTGKNNSDRYSFSKLANKIQELEVK